MVFGAGLAVGLAFWGVIAAIGMGVLLQGSVYALSAMKVAGAVCLLYLALRSSRAAIYCKDRSGAPQGGWRRSPGGMADMKWWRPRWSACLSDWRTTYLRSGELHTYALAFSLPGAMAC